MKKPYRFLHFEVRRFPRNIEITCFNKHGGFIWALYLHLPIYGIIGKSIHREAMKTLGQ